MQNFIVSIKQHSVLGYILQPLLIDARKEETSEIIRTNLVQDVKKDPDKYTEIQKQIVTLYANYSDETLYKVFNKDKKLSIVEFMSNIDKNLLDNYLKPKVQKNIAKIITLIEQNNIGLFIRQDMAKSINISDKIYISSTLGEAIFNFEKTEEGLKYYLSVKFEGSELILFKRKNIVLIDSPACIILGSRLIKFSTIDTKKIQPFYSKKYILVSKNIENKYLKTFVLNAIKEYNVNTIGFDIKETKPNKKVTMSLESDIYGYSGLVLRFYYNNIYFYPDSKEKTIVNFDEELCIFNKFSRDFEWEKNSIIQAKQLGLSLQKDRIFRIKSKKSDKNEQNLKTIVWLNNNYNKIKEKGFTISQKLSTKKYFLQEIKLEIELSEEIDWFDIKVIALFGDFRIPFYELKENLLNNKREFCLPNGEYAIIPEVWFSKYTEMLRLAEKQSDTNIKLKKIHYSVLPKKEKRHINNLLADLQSLSTMSSGQQVALPQGITSKLRDYQEIGYSWLTLLRKNNFGGCLADDMGLGKTVQILVAIQKLKEEKNVVTDELFPIDSQKILNLVVVPYSLLHNWRNEIKKHTPNLRSLLYTGISRHILLSEFKNFDIIITSYGILRNDLDLLLEYNYNFIILDESQYIKNRKSKIYKCVKQLQGDCKIALTGTPIENSLSDLWSQLNFVNDGILGSYSFYKKNYLDLIEKTNNIEHKEKLKKIISPFILRRHKEDVVSDLPPLQTETIICEMTDDQTQIYEEEKSKVRNKILELKGNNQLKNLNIYIIQSLTKLRQICNHPNLIDNSKEYTSGKFDEIMFRIETLINNNHKLLIFSSFVKYLNIFEVALSQKKYKYEILTGKTRQREQTIKNFQENEDINIFLISIKAGGSGINLTKADYVFIADPWWNPAVEQQAIARAYRIGQTQNVFAFKFITFNSIEEKIQKLQKNKSKLAEEYIEANNFYKYLSEDNIINLFE